MLTTFLLWRLEGGYFMQLPSSLREPIQKQLSRFILRSKVRAEDATPDSTLIGVSGNGAAALVQRSVGQVPANVRDVVHMNGVTVIHVPTGRYEIVIPKDKADVVLAALSTGAEKADLEHWEWLDIRAGIPMITPATQEALVPQMANLDLIGGVSFEKGCYPGQEIVARMHYRGTLKQRMYLAHVAGDEKPQPGERLYSTDFGEQACGTIINAARAPEGGFDLLAAVQIASATKGKVHWKAPDGPALKFLPLPYAVPTQE
jgi:folate-binding protein YgfZ